jgi:hypothetical protein
MVVPRPLSAILRELFLEALGTFLFVYLVMAPNGDRSLRAAALGAASVVLLYAIEIVRLWREHRNQESDERLRQTRFAMRRSAMRRAGIP